MTITFPYAILPPPHALLEDAESHQEIKEKHENSAIKQLSWDLRKTGQGPFMRRRRHASIPLLNIQLYQWRRLRVLRRLFLLSLVL
jgi:hypothetical protein